MKSTKSIIGKKLRICVLTHTFPRFPGDPTAPFMEGVCDGLAQAGNRVYVLTPYTNKFSWKSKSKNYTIIPYKYIFIDKLHTLGYSETMVNDKVLKFRVFLLAPFMIVSGFFHLYFLVVTKHIDVISAHWIIPNGFIGALVSMITGVPLVSTLPGSDVYLVRQNSIFYLMGVIAVRFSNAITSNSPQLASDLERTVGRLKLFQPIVYGVDPKKFKSNRNHVASLRKAWQVSKETVVVLGVGRLVEKKGFVYLVKAAKLVIKKHANVRFVIAGTGTQEEELRYLVGTSGLDKYFYFAGKIPYDKLLSYYNASDIFVLPSIRDSEGNLDDQSVSVMEAMACKKPVITSDFFGYRLVIKNGRNGYLAKEKDYVTIARYLNKLVASKKLRSAIATNARQTIVELFTWEKIGQTYTQLFYKLIP